MSDKINFQKNRTSHKMIQEDRSDQLQECPFCRDYHMLSDHIKECTALKAHNIVNNQTHYRIEGQGYLCKFCWALFEEEQWVYHRKKKACRRAHQARPIIFPSTSKKILEKQVSYQSAPLTRQLYNSGQKLEHTYELRGTNNSLQKGLSDLANITAALMTPLIRKWLKQNQNIDMNVLVSYLSSAINQFGYSFFSKPIVVPTWSMIKEINHSLNWNAFLERPENLFRQNWIDDKLSKLPIRKQIRFIKGLNKLAGRFKGLIQKREIPKVRRQTRQRAFVAMADIVRLISQLFQCRKKSTTHLALDLYIILLSAQRFLADWQAMQKGILEMLAQNRQCQVNDMRITYRMVIGKTNQTQDVCLNAQLCIMLRQFQWQRFHPKTYRIVERMTAWLGITGYTLKDTMLNTIASVSSDLKLSQRAAGHQSQTTTSRYTKLTAISDSLRVTNQIIVPGLHSKFGKYNEPTSLTYLQSLKVSNIKYASFFPDWLERLLPRLYSSQFQHQYQEDEEVDFTIQQQQMQLREQPIHQHAEKIESEQNYLGNVDDILYDLQHKSEVLIYGLQAKLDKNKFMQENFFTMVQGYEDLKCISCLSKIQRGQTRMKCVFCEGNHHFSCAKTICICSVTDQKLDSPSISAKFLKISRQTIKMPKQYSRSRTTDEQQQIKLLFALRRFRYTRIPIISPGYNIQLSGKYWGNAEQIIIGNYEQYIQGQYMPPIQARPIQSINNHPVFGVQYGLFAIENIAEKVLIGEYACDLLQGKDLLLCKKYDSIMRYTQGSDLSDVYLAPKDYGGYILLMNSDFHNKDKKSLINCQSLKTIINGSLRIIIITSRRIKKGEQLKYNYGNSYEYR